MEIRTDLYIREEDRGQLKGDGPVDLWMRHGQKCKPSNPINSREYKFNPVGMAYARELSGGLVVCVGCQHGTCQVPEGIGHGRELHINKEENES